MDVQVVAMVLVNNRSKVDVGWMRRIFVSAVLDPHSEAAL